MMAAERGASRNTLDAYRRDLMAFDCWLVERKSSVRTASRDQVRQYLAHIARQGNAASTQARRLSALRQYFGFLYAENWRGDDPTTAIDAPRRAQALPRTLSQQDIEALIAAARDEAEKSAEGVRLICLLEVLYAAGLRVSELVTLSLAAARSRDAFLIVKGKGNKERLVPLNPSARAAIREYLAVRERFLSPGARMGERYLFPSRGRQGHLTRQRCYQLL